MDTCKPLDITPYLHLIEGKNNTINMKCTPRHIMYVVSFQFVRTVSIQNLILDIQRDKFETESTILKQCTPINTNLHKR